MKTQTAKKAGAVIGAVALASAGIAGAVPALASEAPVEAAAAQKALTRAADAAAVADVHGAFDFNQSATSSNASITQVFAKASAMLCNGLPAYGVMSLAQSIAVSGDVDSAFAATVSEMAEKAEARNLLMACACASNVPGGGAIINAEVSGVTLESVADMAGATAK